MVRRTFVGGGLAVAVAMGLVSTAPALGASEPEGAALKVRVTLNGEPAAGLDIRLRAVERVDSEYFPDVTDANGYFSTDEIPTTATDPDTTWLVEASGFEAEQVFPGLDTYAGNTTRAADATRFTFAPGSTTAV